MKCKRMTIKDREDRYRRIDEYCDKEVRSLLKRYLEPIIEKKLRQILKKRSN